MLAEAIQTRLSDPRIPPLTSITRVEVAPDLASARVRVSVMAPEAQRKLCVEALRQAGGRLRAVVAEQVVLRHVPRLVFVLDDSVRRACETVESLNQIMAELNARQPAQGTTPEEDSQA